MAGNTWQLSPRLKRRDLPREKEGQNYNSVFDDNRHRFLEDLSQIQETERNFVVCLSQRYEMENGDFYKLYLTDSVDKLKQEPQNVFVTSCDCDDFKYNGNKSECKHILLFEILKESLIVEPPEPLAEPIADPESDPEPIADPESESESEEEPEPEPPRRRPKQKKNISRALARLKDSAGFVAKGRKSRRTGRLKQKKTSDRLKDSAGFVGRRSSRRTRPIAEPIAESEPESGPESGPESEEEEPRRRPKQKKTVSRALARLKDSAGFVAKGRRSSRRTRRNVKR